MSGRISNHFIVIDNGKLDVYTLDDKLIWEIGRCSKENKPDIRMYTTTISRKHGKFQNMNGIWYYVDYNGKNGTVYNGNKIVPRRRGRLSPISISDGDVFIFGGNEKAIINAQTVWGMYSTKEHTNEWRVVDTKGYKKFLFSDGEQSIELSELDKGHVVNWDKGMAIYMENVTYLSGEMSLECQ